MVDLIVLENPNPEELKNFYNGLVHYPSRTMARWLAVRFKEVVGVAATRAEAEGYYFEQGKVVSS